MAQLQSGKYTIAWFKLAEFVGRKEKERALGIYRLLAHSLHDPALVFQLEGDLLFSFEDDKAIDSYAKAAQIYTKNNKIIQAIAIYENILTNKNANVNFMDFTYKLVQLYSKLNASNINLKNEHKIIRAIFLLSKLIINYNKIELVDSILCDRHISDKHKVVLCENIVINSIEKNSLDKSELYKHIQFVVKWLYTNDDKKLQQFIAKLNVIDIEIYKYTCDYILSMA